MDAFSEAVERSAQKQAIKLNVTSLKAFRELVLRVREDPSRYITDAPEQALLVLDRALKAHAKARVHNEFLDDDAFVEALNTAMQRLANACDEALALDPHCLDASVIKLIATATPLDKRVRAVDKLVKPQLKDPPAPRSFAAAHPKNPAQPSSPAHASPGHESQKTFDPKLLNLLSPVFFRPVLRALAAQARWAFGASLHRRAVAASKELLKLNPADELGTRFTLALVLARLEDEASLEALDRAAARKGNAWIALGRTLLLFKLDRLSAARRALVGYITLYESGAFVLSHPAFVEPYLPDRPPFVPRSLEEVTFAVHEAEPLITDTPDFVGWCRDQEGFNQSASSFAERMGFDF